MEQLKQWYENLDQNDQRIVMFATIFFSILIIIFGLLKPLSDSVSKLEGQVDARQRSVANWKEAMPKLIANRGQTNTTASNQPLNSVVTSSSRRFNLTVSRIQEKGADEIQVWFDNVPFNDFVRWVEQLTKSHGVKVASVNIRNKERNGLTSIDVKLQKG